MTNTNDKYATNPALSEALATYEKVCTDYVSALEEKGLKFAEANDHAAENAELRRKLAEAGANIRNGGASISMGWLSPACEACTGNTGSETFSTTFKCHRDCYFCFNYNLADYDKFCKEGCPWEEGLARAEECYDSIACIGLTGGEPLLSLDDSVRFLERAHEIFPDTHLRMYTSGDLLTPEAAERLRDAGLTEIRFSVKNDDTNKLQERVLANMAMAKDYFRDVVVEMPIVPNSRETMQWLFTRFQEIGIRGINLLEFCFPFHSWEEYEKRGYELKNPPFEVMYDYGYSGGLAVDGSEELCLEMMLWAHEQGMTFGMHYCSLENKHRSEFRQKNERAAHVHPCLAFDDQDFYLKCVKVFGDECAIAKAQLSAAGCADFIEDDEEKSLAFHPRYLKMLNGMGLTPMYAFFVLEQEDGSSYLRDLALKPIE